MVLHLSKAAKVESILDSFVCGRGLIVIKGVRGLIVIKGVLKKTERRTTTSAVKGQHENAPINNALVVYTSIEPKGFSCELG